MKALVGLCADVAQFPPGHFFNTVSGELNRYYVRPWREYGATQGVTVSAAELRGALERAVHRQLMSDVPYGVLLSGGLDSSWLKAHASSQVTDRDFARAAARFPVNPPQSKEAYFYRRLFEQYFPDAACAMTVPGGKSIACSSPAAIAWDEGFAKAADPSGRAVVGVHHAASREPARMRVGDVGDAGDLAKNVSIPEGSVYQR